MISPSPAHRSRRPRFGFTLVELMVVIVIVATLAGLVFSLATRARTKANSISCLQNLRDWSLVFSSCAGDHNGRLPTAKNWASISDLPYNPAADDPGQSPFLSYWAPNLEAAKRILTEKCHCPCIKSNAEPDLGPDPTYMMNAQISRQPEFLQLPMGDLTRAASKVLLIDGNVGCPSLLGDSSDVTTWIEPVATVHGGKVNAIYADLHVGSLHPKELRDQWDARIQP